MLDCGEKSDSQLESVNKTRLAVEASWSFNEYEFTRSSSCSPAHRLRTFKSFLLLLGSWQIALHIFFSAKMVYFLLLAGEKGNFTSSSSLLLRPKSQKLRGLTPYISVERRRELEPTRRAKECEIHLWVSLQVLKARNWIYMSLEVSPGRDFSPLIPPRCRCLTPSQPFYSFGFG